MLIGNTVNNTYRKQFWKLKINLLGITKLTIYTTVAKEFNSELSFYENKSWQLVV